MLPGGWRRALAGWLRRAPEPAGAAGWGSTEPLVAGREFGQWIRAAQPDLCEVQVLIAAHGRATACTLEFAIRTAPADPAPLATLGLHAAALASNAYRAFSFPPIADSAGRRYYVSLRSPDASAGNAIVIAAHPAWDRTVAAVVDGAPQSYSWRYLCRYGDGPPEDPADFAVLAERFLRFAVERCRLAPTGRVLDVGCRRGSWAVTLTGYLRDGGAYEGFDIVAEDIDWCRKRITFRHPNFAFRVADIHNQAYNPAGTVRASEFEFPYASGSFDFVFLISVFTHMLPADVAHYLSEIARVLRPRGTCLISAFLLNAGSRRLMAAGRSDVVFAHGEGAWRTVDPVAPEAAIAYDEAFLREGYRKNGLAIDEPIHYGSWPGRADALAYQDVVVATRLPDRATRA